MLVELAIRDFAIIEETRILFGEGLNALTGETGAGKSILIDALGAVLGERTGVDVVRTGAKVARIEATLDLGGADLRPELRETLDEVGIAPDDGVLILAREISAAGRSSARVNGQSVTTGTLNRIGALLVDIHGQSDHLSLLRPSAQLDLLDRYAGLLPTRDALAVQVRELAGVRSRLAEIVGNARERAQRVDLLRFQRDEIAAADLRPGEEEELTAQRAVLANAERLAGEVASGYAMLVGDEAMADDQGVPAVPAVRKASQLLSAVAEVDGRARQLDERLAEALLLLEDASADLRSYRDSIEADPERLAAIEDRLDELKRLKRKYGSTVGEVIEFGNAAAAELERLTGAEEDVDALRERESVLVAEVGRLASDLSRRRAEAGNRLARDVESAIAELNMGRARFAVAFAQTPSDRGIPLRSEDGQERRVAVDATGADKVEFLIAVNAGEALKPLARVASGGETARLGLALKSILSEADATPTLVFDEVDVGVGGRSGQVVGEKLWGLSNGHQVLVITHLPQIAAFAESHFRIVKREHGGRVVSSVEPIERGDRVDELAAMLDGEPVTDASRRNARAMLERVGRWKEHGVASPATESEPA